MAPSVIAHCIGGPANGQIWALPDGQNEMTYAIQPPIRYLPDISLGDIRPTMDIVIYRAVRDPYGELVMYDLESVEFRLSDPPKNLPIWRATT